MLAGGAMPAAHYVHPEFGLLCPTPRLRRKLRIVFACMILALIGGAVLRAANTPLSANSSSVMAAAGREKSADTSPDAGQAPAASLATRPSLSAGAETGAVKSVCEQGGSLHRTWAYLEGKCVAGKARKPRTVHVATDRPAIAAIAIGRMVAPGRTRVLRGEHAHRFPGRPTQIRAGPARRGGGCGRAAPAACRGVQEAAENGAQPPAPARAGRDRCRLVARGARRRLGCARLWRARLWPWRIRPRGRFRLGLQ